jgi:hypothetical protein
MKIAFLTFVTALGLFATASRAGAQILTDIQRELETTDLRIERAETIVSGSGNESARLELEQAVSLQTRAKEELAAGHPRIALDLTYRARGHADRAIALVRGLPDPDRVRTQLERTRELVERVRDQIEECSNDRARAMLHAATEMQSRAEAAAEASRYLAALQLTRGARERALDALRLCNLQEDLRDSSERALRRTDEVIARAQDRVSEHPSEQARQTLARAVDLEDRATREFRAGHFEASLRLTQNARALAFRAIRLSSSS